MTSNEHKLARTLVEAHVDPAVAPVVLDAVDAWASVVDRAQEALEQSQRSADDLNRYFTIPELRLLLRKSDSGVRALLDDGALPFTRIGEGRNSIRVPRDAVERYLEQQTTQHTPTQPKRPAAPRLTDDEQAVVRRWPGLVD